MRTRRAAPRPGLALAALASVLGAASAGCQKQLFSATTPRTQFERYDAIRSGATPTEEPDVFGRPQPALRARLSPKTD